MLFSEVAQHLSYTAAAEKLGISRGHLSSQVRQLEKDMEMTLLIRSTRCVRLTDEGRWVLSGMEKILHYLVELERDVETEGKAIEGTLKITAPLQFTERYLLDICAQFKALHPDIEFSIDCSYTNHDLTRSDFNLAFRATNEPPQNMVAVPLFKYLHRCCASPDYIRTHGMPLVPSDLNNHQCLHGQDQPVWTFKEGEVYAQGWMQINSNQQLKNLALNGSGIIRLPDYMVDQEIAEGKLVDLLDHSLADGKTMHLIYPQLIHQSKRMSTFIQFSRQYFSKIRPNNPPPVTTILEPLRG